MQSDVTLHDFPSPSFATQLPPALQVLAPVHVSESSLLVTVVQVPGVALHVWHALVQALPQQNPSVHVVPVAHSRQPAALQSTARLQALA